MLEYHDREEAFNLFLETIGEHIKSMLPAPSATPSPKLSRVRSIPYSRKNSEAKSTTSKSRSQCGGNTTKSGGKLPGLPDSARGAAHKRDAA